MRKANRGTVLVVDDDDDLLAMITEVLEADGFTVRAVSNAADAIHFVDEHAPPCAVLVDMVMPGIIGTSLLDYLRHEQRLANIPVAVVSGSPQLAPSGYRVLGKPVDREALLGFVREGCLERPES